MQYTSTIITWISTCSDVGPYCTACTLATRSLIPPLTPVENIARNLNLRWKPFCYFSKLKTIWAIFIKFAVKYKYSVYILLMIFLCEFTSDAFFKPNASPFFLQILSRAKPVGSHPSLCLRESKRRAVCALCHLCLVDIIFQFNANPREISSK